MARIQQELLEQVQENAKLKQDNHNLNISLDNQQQELFQTREKSALELQAQSDLIQKIQSESHQEKQELLEQISTLEKQIEFSLRSHQSNEDNLKVITSLKENLKKQEKQIRLFQERESQQKEKISQLELKVSNIPKYEIQSQESQN
jgi:hypothetical protein